MTPTTLDKPIKAPTFHPIEHRAARSRTTSPPILFAASFVIAMIPLVLAAVHGARHGAIRAIISSTWWSHSLAGVLPERVHRRCVSRDLRHDRPGGDRGRASRCRWASWPRSTWSSTAAAGSPR